MQIFDKLKSFMKKTHDEESPAPVKVMLKRLSLECIKDEQGYMLDRDYTIFVLTPLDNTREDFSTTENGYRALIQELQKAERVEAICTEGGGQGFVRGTKVYILHRKPSDAFLDHLNESVSKRYSIWRRDVRELYGPANDPETDERYIILRLILNSVVNGYGGGWLNVTSENLIFRDTRCKGMMLRFLKLSINENCAIEAHCTTYSQRDEYLLVYPFLGLKTKIEEIYKMPVFRFRDGLLQYMNGGVREGDPELFIHRSLNPFKKNVLAEIRWKSNVLNGKAKIIKEAVKYMNEKFGNYVSIGFEKTRLDWSYEHKGLETRKKNAKDTFAERLKGTDINIVSRLDPVDKGMRLVPILENSIREFLSEFGIPVGTSEECRKESLNLVLIHDKDYSSKKDRDEYFSPDDEGKIVQHVTVETLEETLDSYVKHQVSVAGAARKRQEKKLQEQKEAEQDPDDSGTSDIPDTFADEREGRINAILENIKKNGSIPENCTEETPALPEEDDASTPEIIRDRLPDYMSFILVNELIVKRDITEGIFSFPCPDDVFRHGTLTFVQLKTMKIKKKEEQEEEKKEKKKGKEKKGEEDKTVIVLFALDINPDRTLKFYYGRPENFPEGSPNREGILEASNFLQTHKRFNLASTLVIVSENAGGEGFYDKALIHSAPFSLMPDLGAMMRYLSEGKSLKSRETREECFAGYYGICSFQFNNRRYVLAGLMPDGITGYQIPTTVIPKVIECVGDRKKMENITLSLMDNIYLLRSRMSVFPVTHKYLSEYFLTWNRTIGKEFLDLQREETDADGNDPDAGQGPADGYD